jgi:dihydropteroate synthase
MDKLHRQGVADVIVDPGFGFGKTVEQNYALLRQLDVLQTLHAPVLVGVSRKSMLYRPLETTPDDVLAATVAANTLALERGAHILRVHDVKAAIQAIQIHQLTHPCP